MIVIDPGHGGEDPGAVYRTLLEKDVVLDVARLIPKQIPQVDIRFTRETDVYVPLMDRCNIANNSGSAFFLSIHCCPKDTMVTMAGGVVKPIQGVTVGEYVMDSTGMPSKVKRVYSRTVSEEIKRFSAFKSTNPLLVTKEHPVLINSGNSMRYVEARNVLRKHQLCMPILNFECPYKQIDVVSCFASPYSYGIDDYTVRAKRSLFIKQATTKPFMRFVDLDEEFLWLLGLFAADGSCALKHYGNTSFGLNSLKDKAKIERVVGILKSFGFEPRIRQVRGCSVVYVVSNIFANLMRYFISGDCYTKKLNDLLMFLPAVKQRHILEGWIDGDGTRSERMFKADTVSPSLANQMLHISMRCGLHPSLAKQKPASGYGTSAEASYRLAFSSNDKNGLKPKKNVFFSEHRYRLCPDIKSIDEIDYSGEVFNLETETGSYVANNFAVHNCNADLDPDLPGMKEAKGEEIWFPTQKPGRVYGTEQLGRFTKSNAAAMVMQSFVDECFPDEPFRGIKPTSGLWVLNGTKMPAILVELGFIDNSSTARRLEDELVKMEIAQWLGMGLLKITQQDWINT